MGGSCPRVLAGPVLAVEVGQTDPRGADLQIDAVALLIELPEDFLDVADRIGDLARLCGA